MKRYIAAIAILLLLGAFSWGQGTREPFDVKKSTEELEIMKGILNTTLSFIAQNAPKTASRGRFSNQSAFYLAGQGAVFVISTSELRFSGPPNFSSVWSPEFSAEMSQLNDEISRYSQEIQVEAARTAREALELSNRSGKWATPAPPAPPAAPAPAAPPTPPTPPTPPAPASIAPRAEQSAKLGIDREKLRKTVEEAQARAKKAREDASENREKFLQNLAEVKTYLVEALANYGDSLTTVKPDEYLNLVLLTNGFDGQRTRSDVISARKSWITDYKAGRLNLDGFKQKVLQYNQ